MEYIYKIAIVVQYLILLGAIYIFKKYMPSYLSEKGRNLATKQDIAEITEEVKKVESMFSVKTSGEIDFNSLRNKYIMEYYSSLCNLEYLLMTNLPSGDELNFKLINSKLLEKIEKAETELVIKGSYLDLLFFSVDNQEYTDIKHNISQYIQQLLNLSKRHIRDSEFIRKQRMDKMEQLDELSNLNNDIYERKAELIRENWVGSKHDLLNYLNKSILNTFKK
ncbi:hypothetical protein HZQ19_01815 [Elizabethkingia anophelis]|uniref:hypothetical protein n=1 Tax=Elizabethkingia anophelis TaxID=1117645 RepID=UPI000C9AEAC4|nr:hypothetical protein [Elizabethkingia anophelis]MCT3758434.1 hypothetical protein [Elizabethkingia anophelis]MCT3971918.1 hypothetical protein [Elizabethkingia anophelis]MCT4000395.1 hypothetical protein [Elizabethkingia anophelis]MCT4014624.1 hypothetical protein [Elizabethkingia anophelis]MCT4018185.1 hypothetical protein [Elizabethkingia anophelis]